MRAVKGRAFRKQQDIRKLQVFLAAMRHQVAQAAYFQFGDLMWRMSYGPNGFDEDQDLRLWESADDRIDGFVFYHPPDDNPEFFLRPELYDSQMADEMVAWAVARGRARNASSIETSCIDCDTVKAEFLKRAGFEPCDDVMVFMEREVMDAIPSCRLPRGYTIVSGADRPGNPSVTGRSSLTREAYEHLRRAPGYRDDLGLGICYQDQSVVAGCICWYDEVDNCGEFEPVGTRG
jgi:hypothetical protein